MYATLRNWLLGPARRPPGAFVAVPAPNLEEAAGKKILSARARRLEILEETRNLLIGIPMQARPALVDRVAERFAAYVGDLPASERNHECQEYGLLDHSLEVARAAVGELVRPGFRVSEDPALNYRDQPVWAYSGFVLGLLHDLGKVFELDVLPPGGETPWNPGDEPLMAFLRRYDLASSGSDSWRWKPGRGQNQNIRTGNGLVPLVLPHAAKQLLGGRLGILLETFARSYTEGKEDWERGPAGRVVKAVRRWDKVSAKEELQAKRDAESAEMEEIASSASQPPPPVLMAPESLKTEATVCPATAAPPAPRSAEEPPPTQPPPEPAALPAPQAIQQPTPEREGQIRFWLEPTRLIAALRSWVRAGNVRRNCPKADFFVCTEYLWIRYPQAFINLFESSQISWSGAFGEQLLDALLEHPQVAPLDQDNVIIMASPMPTTKDEIPFIRIRSSGFLPEAELASLGFWAPGMKVVKQPVAEAADMEGE